MKLKGDAKFEEKLALSSKNDLTNLVNFNMSSGKSKYLHVNVLLLLIAYKVSTEGLSVTTLKNDSNFEKKFIFCLKNDIIW